MNKELKEEIESINELSDQKRVVNIMEIFRLLDMNDPEVRQIIKKKMV
jgi:hypothetical protein